MVWSHFAPKFFCKQTKSSWPSKMPNKKSHYVFNFLLIYLLHRCGVSKCWFSSTIIAWLFLIVEAIKGHCKICSFCQATKCLEIPQVSHPCGLHGSAYTAVPAPSDTRQLYRDSHQWASIPQATINNQSTPRRCAALFSDPRCFSRVSVTKRA